MPIIDILPSTQTYSTKEDSEIAQESYSSSEIFQDLKNQRTIFKTDALRPVTGLKANHPKKLFTSQEKEKKTEKKKKKKREVFCLLGTINELGYTMTKLTAVFIALFVKMSTIITCWMALE